MSSTAKKVLVVEDNLMNMELASELLTSAGIEVLQAPVTERGMEIAREEAPDLILMDVQLPGMDGLTAIRHLKRSEETRGIPIVVLSAHAMRRHAEEARDAGAVGYIAKPIDTRSFVTRVLSHLPQS